MIPKAELWPPHVQTLLHDYTHMHRMRFNKTRQVIVVYTYNSIILETEAEGWFEAILNHIVRVCLKK